MKKRVAILYSGQTRCNGLNSTYTHDDFILESTKKYLLNDEFKETYDYDVFFSVDTLDVQKARELFGEHLKNIHFTETNWCMNPVPILSYQGFYDKYCSTDFKHCDNHIHGLYQYYRLYCVYQLLDTEYDYYIRIRPDLRLMMNLMPLLHRLESDEKLHLIMEHDHLFLTDRLFVPLFKFIEKIGSFTEEVDVHNPIFKHLVKGGSLTCDKTTRFCPERQLVEYVREIVQNNDMQWNEAFLGIIYPSYYLMYRGLGQYGYAEYTENDTWIPSVYI